ncbi:MAG: hypothetical protein JWQ07_255 [Ramlibacter sp.]|nr:hypothetical protein [Ramlibacter sp.]
MVCLLTYRADPAGLQNVRMDNVHPAERVTYGITALRYAGAQIVEAMMGLIDSTRSHWDLRPTPARLTEVVDRLVEGDTVISLFPDDSGGLEPGPEVKVDVLAEGTETLSLDEEAPGRSLRDLPRF